MIRRGALAAACAFAITVAGFVLDGRLSGPYRIDEAHKIADTYFFGLLMRGDFSNPDWLRHIVDRTNPPVGKFVFGAAAWLQGAPLAEDLLVRVEQPEGRLGQSLAGDSPERFRPTLTALRRASVFAIALCAAVICAAGVLATSSVVTGVIAALLFSTSFLALTHGASAVYDPLLACFVALGSLPSLAYWRTRNRPALWGAVAGLLFALAAQTRLTGFISIFAGLAIAAAMYLRGRKGEAAVFAAVMLLVTGIVATIVNPYYWTNGGVTVVPARYAAQLEDLEALREREARSQNALSGPVDRTLFAAEYLFADLSGMALGAGLGLAALYLLPSMNDPRRRAGLAGAFLWSATTAIAFTAVMPFAWSRHLLTAVPALALMGGIGWGELARRWTERKT